MTVECTSQQGEQTRVGKTASHAGDSEIVGEKGVPRLEDGDDSSKHHHRPILNKPTNNKGDSKKSDNCENQPVLSPVVVGGGDRNGFPRHGTLTGGTSAIQAGSGATLSLIPA